MVIHRGTDGEPQGQLGKHLSREPRFTGRRTHSPSGTVVGRGTGTSVRPRSTADGSPEGVALPLVYRTLVAVPERQEDLLTTASTILSRWLSKRGNSGAQVGFSTSGHYELSSRSRALVARHDNPEEKLSFLRLTTESDKPDGTWRTTVSVVTDPALSPWQYVWLDMAVEPRADTQQSDQPLRLDIMPPEAARMLLDEIDAYDGTYPLSPVPRIVRGRDEALVDTLLSAIHDPKRRLAVVATGAPRDVTVAAWHTAMTSVLSRSTGMCAGYVLDTTALDRVGSLLPQELDIPAGGVRTFLPRIDLAETGDSGRHPRMSPATLDTARSGERIRNWVGAALSRKVRDNAVELPLPEPLTAIDTLLHEEIKDLRAKAFKQPSYIVAPGTPTTTAALEAQEQQAQRLREEVTRLNSRIEELTTERHGLLAENSDLREELGTTREELRSARHEIGWLRDRTRDAGLYRLASTAAPPDPGLGPPRNVRELLERITDGSALPHLFFTIEDHDTVYELSDNRKETLWVTRAWEAMLALNDYARYQFDNPGIGLGFHSYLKETPDGYRVIPVKRLASQESDYVRNRGKLNEKRLFPVPHEVDPSGRIPMYAHIKLDIEYGICPRMYFFPHLGNGTTNRIYVGYLGRHLPVQQSN